MVDIPHSKPYSYKSIGKYKNPKRIWISDQCWKKKWLENMKTCLIKETDI